MVDKLSEYYEKAFEKAGENGSIYNPMSVLELAGHEQKGLLLSQLPLPDLSSLTVLDYGVGSWGFGCVFPKLKECKQGIGIDVSEYAIECSKKASDKDKLLANKNITYLTSNGYNIKLDNSSIDVAFAGECIEHIEDTDAFLSEIWRILKDDGIAIFTTPNEKPYLYKQLGLKWAMGFEHVALMDSYLLLDKLSQYFEIEVKKGYVSTISPELDQHISDVSFANNVASLCEDSFSDASGLIVLVRKKKSKKPKISQVTHVIVESDEVTAKPEYRDLSLYESANGRMAYGENCALSINIPKNAIRCQLVLWSHPWSGIAKIKTDKTEQEIDLYSHQSGCTRVSLSEEDLRNSQMITITATENKNSNSSGYEVIIFRAVFSLDSK